MEVIQVMPLSPFLPYVFRLSAQSLIQLANDLKVTSAIRYPVDKQYLLSNSLIEGLEVYISFDTSVEDIEYLRLEMESFVRCPENRRDFYANVVFWCVGVGSIDKLQI